MDIESIVNEFEEKFYGTDSSSDFQVSQKDFLREKLNALLDEIEGATKNVLELDYDKEKTTEEVGKIYRRVRGEVL